MCCIGEQVLGNHYLNTLFINYFRDQVCAFIKWLRSLSDEGVHLQHFYCVSRILFADLSIVLYCFFQDFPNWGEGYMELFLVIMKKRASKENDKLILFLTTRQ